MFAQPFTWAYYDACLAAARSAEYRFIGFSDLRDGSREPGEPFVLLRHDIDYDPEFAGLLASREEQQSVRATYFFQADSRFYDLTSPVVVAIVRRILHQGHWLGVHFDANGIEDDATVIQRVQSIAEELEARFQRSVDAVSFHMPTYRSIGHLRLGGGRVNTYGPVFFGPIEYASDSNQDFRGKDILSMLRAGTVRRLQLLIHPFWWREEYSPLITKMEALGSRLGVSLGQLLTAEQWAAIGRPRVMDLPRRTCP